MVCVTVYFFGPARALVGEERIELNIESGQTVADIKWLLEARFSTLRGAMKTFRLAVNEEFVPDVRPLSPGDCVAVIPPVSGGCEDETILIDLCDQPLNTGALRDFVGSGNEHGAIAIFEGVTRREVDQEHGAIIRLDYEAYESMARRQLFHLARIATDRWGVFRIAIAHRIGGVPAGETSVYIAVACAHRAEAFEACRWLIDTLKAEVPIWKKDVYEDGFVRWVEPNGLPVRPSA